MNARSRVLVALVLFALVFGMGIHYDINDDEHWPYPTTDSLAEDYDQYVGEQALLFGTVQEINTDTETARIRVESSMGAFNITVQNFNVTVQPGGVVQVVGTLQSSRVIVAQNVRVVNPAGSSKLYKYAISLVGALLVVVLFFRYWRVDIKTLSFEVR